MRWSPPATFATVTGCPQPIARARRSPVILHENRFGFLLKSPGAAATERKLDLRYFDLSRCDASVCCRSQREPTWLRQP